jgi:hypothetical protein
MKWLSDWKTKLGHGVGYKLSVTLMLLILVAGMVELGLPCPFERFLHIPCMGCGMSRAWMSVLNLDFQAAFSYHFMFWSVPPMVLCFWLDWEPFSKKWANTLLYTVVLAGFGINWLIHLFL